MKLALVHDYLVDSGGAERTLLELHRLFPDAPIFTSVYDAATAPGEFAAADVRASAILRPVSTKSRYKFALPLYPLIFGARRMRGYDVVLSSASAFAKAVAVEPPALHVCYCYTPPRFVWQLDRYAAQERLGRATQAAVRSLAPYFRAADRRAAASVHRFAAISDVVRDRIQAAYGRDADVVAPPVDLERFRLGAGDGGYFLVVSRLNRYKRVDLVVEAFNRLRLPLVVAGTGADQARLRALAGPTVRLVGRVPDDELVTLYQGASALILPGEEDFGLTPLEANASGRPVLAYAAGGARETVIQGETGILFPEQTVDSLVAGVEHLQSTSFDPARLRRHAERYSVAVFRRNILDLVGAVVAENG